MSVGGGEAFDPQASLDLLANSKTVAGDNVYTDLGPTWYAPLLATGIGGFALCVRGTTQVEVLAFGTRPLPNWPFWWLALLVGVVSLLFLGLHDYRRRRIRLKRRWSKRNFLWFLPSYLAAYLSLQGWLAAIGRVGIEDFVPLWAAAAWCATTAVWLATRGAVHSAARRWVPRT